MTKDEIKVERKHMEERYGHFYGRFYKDKKGLLYRKNIKVWEFHFYYEFINFGKERSPEIQHGISKKRHYIPAFDLMPPMSEISRKEYSEAKKRFLAKEIK